MEQAAGKPAEDSRLGAADEEALEAIRFGWGDAYEIEVWRAKRRDGLGGWIEVVGPDELRQAITENYALKRVPREPAARVRPDGGKAVRGADPGALLTRSPEP